MSHECDDCGQEFETLSERRLHDCQAADNGTGREPSPGTDTGDGVQIPALDEQLEAVDVGEFDALHQAIALYESQLSDAHESDQHERYRGVSSTYRERLITALDDATRAEGWAFLEGFLDAYHPTTAEELSHVTPVLENVAARHMIRTRLGEGVAAISVGTLEYFRAILEKNPEGYGYILEGVHPYGWGIGHPEHPVADTIHEHASRDQFVANPMLEHAFYADQYAAVDLLERIVHDESIQYTFDHPTGEITKTRHLLDAAAGAASDHSPMIPRYWDWEVELGYSFELDDTVEQRLRALVVETGLEKDLPSDWEFADLLL